MYTNIAYGLQNNNKATVTATSTDTVNNFTLEAMLYNSPLAYWQASTTGANSILFDFGTPGAIAVDAIFLSNIGTPTSITVFAGDTNPPVAKSAVMTVYGVNSFKMLRTSVDQDKWQFRYWKITFETASKAKCGLVCFFERRIDYETYVFGQPFQYLSPAPVTNTTVDIFGVSGESQVTGTAVRNHFTSFDRQQLTYQEISQALLVEMKTRVAISPLVVLVDDYTTTPAPLLCYSENMRYSNIQSNATYTLQLDAYSQNITGREN